MDHSPRPIEVTLAAIVGIVIIETAALITHTDGRYLGIALVAVSGLGGFFLARITRTPSK